MNNHAARRKKNNPDYSEDPEGSEGSTAKEGTSTVDLSAENAEITTNFKRTVTVNKYFQYFQC